MEKQLRQLGAILKTNVEMRLNWILTQCVSVAVEQSRQCE